MDNNRQIAKKLFEEHFMFKDNPIAWTAWKMAFQLGMLTFSEHCNKPMLTVRCSRKLIDITDEDAINAALIAEVANNPVIERFGGKDNGSIKITDGQKNRSVRIYFNGSNTRVLDNGYEVIEYCFDIYDYLRSLGYVW